MVYNEDFFYFNLNTDANASCYDSKDGKTIENRPSNLMRDSFYEAFTAVSSMIYGYDDSDSGAIYANVLSWLAALSIAKHSTLK